MEISTILKADIKKKRGIFICVILLSTIIVAAFLSILGVTDEFNKGYKKLKEDTNAPAMLYYSYDTFYTPEMKTKIENVEGVKNVIETEAVQSVNNYHRIRHNGVLSESMDRNTYLLEAFSVNKDNIKLFNDKADKYEDTIPALKKGEIYLPYGLKDKLKCQIGDYFVDDFGLYTYIDEKGNEKFDSYPYEFKIVGFVASPMLGANVIGWKEIFISDEDYEDLKQKSIDGSVIIQEKELSTEQNFSLRCNVYKIYSDGSISDNKLAKRINMETKLSTICDGGITATQSEGYTAMYITIIGGVLAVFVIVLLIANLIVISSSISGELETDYKKIGILKALGFSNFKIGVIMALLYLVAEAIGFVLGLIISIFLKQYLGSIFVPITASLPYSYINMLNVLTIVLVMGLSSILFIFIKLFRLRRISPIKAINGSTNDIYFSPRLNMPITKKGLSLSISLKQILSAPLRYVSIVIVTALLALFMLTSVKMSNLTRSDNVAKIFGYPDSSIALSSYSGVPFTNEMMDEVRDVASKYSKIDYLLGRQNTYVSMDGEQIMANINLNPEDMLGVYQGRAPKYDNEFITTKNVCDMYDLKMGDKVTIASKTGEAEFMLVGIYQCLNDVGMNIGLTYEGGLKIDNTFTIHYVSLQLEDQSKVQNVLDDLNTISDNRYRVLDRRNEENSEMKEYSVVCDIICAVIFSFAAVFALITVRLTTVKAFNQERLDLGIYKANGFKTSTLRNQMALRFMIASLIGILLGIILSACFSNQILGLMLYQLGMTKVQMNNKLIDYIVVIVAGGVITYIGAYIASRRIKKVSIRELVVE